MPRPLRFSAFVMNTTSHITHGTWRLPDAQQHEFDSLQHGVSLAQELERGKFDFVFFADVVGLYADHRSSWRKFVESGLQIPSNDPSVVASALAAATSELGIAVTSSILQEHPFNWARKASTLDHATRERVAGTSSPACLPTRGATSATTTSSGTTSATRGPIFRDAATSRTGISAASLNRHVVALVEAGLRRERTDLAPSGAVGRPRLPFELRRDRHLTVGVHISYRTTTITRTTCTEERSTAFARTPRTAPPPKRCTPSERARRFLYRWPDRRALWAGVAVGGRVDADGKVEHPRLGWGSAAAGESIGAQLGLPMSVAPHVESMAAAELAFGAATDPHDSTLYCYANETIGVALTIGGAVHNPRTGPSTIGHLPAGPTRLLDPRGTGRLDDAVSDSGTLEAARASGIPADSTGVLAALAASGDELALALLQERSRVLGRAIGHIADVVNRTASSSEAGRSPTSPRPRTTWRGRSPRTPRGPPGTGGHRRRGRRATAGGSSRLAGRDLRRSARCAAARRPARRSDRPALSELPLRSPSGPRDRRPTAAPPS